MLVDRRVQFVNGCEESDQLLLVRNVGLDANGCFCKASRKLAAALRLPHHVGAGGEESSS